MKDKKVEIDNYDIGILVARFQVDELHKGHLHVIEQVVKNHDKVIIFLGVTEFTGLRNNALDFSTRKYMIQEKYPDINILPIPNNRDNTEWAKKLDERIREVYKHGDVLLYGGRDSFIPHYIKGGGIFDTTEIDSIPEYSGTDIRNKISKKEKKSKDFRTGVIFNAYNTHSRVFINVSGVIISNDGKKVLMEKRIGESKFRFIGDMLRPKHESTETALKSIIRNRVGMNFELNKGKILFSQKINDWRLRDEQDSMMVILHEFVHSYGGIIPGQGVDKLKWFSFDELKELEIMEEEQKILEKYLKIKK